MAFTVVYDANVLYPSYLRDLLIRVAEAGLVQAKWSAQILDETFRNLRTNRPDLDPVKVSTALSRRSTIVDRRIDQLLARPGGTCQQVRFFQLRTGSAFSSLLVWSRPAGWRSAG